MTWDIVFKVKLNLAQKNADHKFSTLYPFREGGIIFTQELLDFINNILIMMLFYYFGKRDY